MSENLKRSLNRLGDQRTLRQVAHRRKSSMTATIQWTIVQNQPRNFVTYATRKFNAAFAKYFQNSTLKAV